ncbi:hypothetical protein LIER_39468 [Lithospermum erythrorhizon]|uniref:Uncharacterized protein n=1 Tax=Lithospermum erythrorhizon TaxID=34254 RepID=A0AAV3QIE7_LITER
MPKERKERGDLECLSRIKQLPMHDLPLNRLRELGRDNPREPAVRPYRYRMAIDNLQQRYVQGLLGNQQNATARFEEADRFKLILAKSFLHRSDINLGALVSKLDEWLPAPWTSKYLWGYEEPLSPRQSSLLECLFTVEVIRRYTCGDSQDTADGLASVGLFAQARYDLIVHGNSPPFKALEGIFYLAFPSYEASPVRNFMKLCIAFFNESMLIATDSQASAAVNHLQQQMSSGSEIKDLLDLVRKCHAPLFPRQPPSDPMKLTAMRKANYLEEAGMSIRPASNDTSVCSIHYREGRLEIPKLKINNQSEHLLMNLIQHELEHYPNDSFINDYLHFMDSLIDTEKDVDVLIHNNILDNYFTDSKGVATLLNKITSQAPLLPHTYYYNGISEAVNAYCSIPRHRWKATLRRDYCSSPWMIASTIAAIILLVLTLIQTVCSIISAIK